jgi:TRAP transporter 4TM/12TM fusion protein
VRVKPDDTPITDETPSAKVIEEIVERAEAPTRVLTGGWGRAVTGALILMSLYHLFAVVATIPTQAFRASHLLFVMPLTFLIYPAGKGNRARVPWYDMILALLGVVTTGYILVDFNAFIERSVIPKPLDILMGATLIALVLEATRRTIGLFLTGLVSVFLLYGFFGNVLPGAWAHRGYDLERIVGHVYMTLEGMFGVPLDVAATYIILFTLYGAIIDASNAGKFFVDLSFSATGRSRSGAGRGVLLASFLLGGPSGSGVATTVTVGTITHGILKRAGYPRDAAAGMLAAGGIGAVISPPVLGAAAFLIAEFVQVSYLTVLAYSIVPTVLYYLGVLLMLELDARRFNLQPVTVDAPKPLPLILKYWYHFISLFLIVILMLIGLTPSFAVAWAIVGAILTSFIREDSSILPRRAVVALVGVFAALLALGRVFAGLDITLDVRGITYAALLAVVIVALFDFVRTTARNLEPSKLNEALATGSKQILNVSVTTAAAGLIIGIVTLTGLGLKFSDLVVSLGGGQLLPTLFFAALSVWVLGLALPITASYIIAAVIVAPALEKLGVPLFAAHMFIFYYAVLSEVSPPVGLSPLAASAITGANFYRAMMETWRYTLPVFVVPFMFSLGDGGRALLLQAPPLEVLIAVTTAVIGLTALVSGAGGWFTRVIPVWIRVLFIAAGGLLIYAGTVQDLIGVALFALAGVCSLTLVRAPRTSSV